MKMGLCSRFSYVRNFFFSWMEKRKDCGEETGGEGLYIVRVANVIILVI